MICIESIIKKAQKDGLFNDLKGQGKPQNLTKNPHEESEDSMAFSMLKDSGFVPPEIKKLHDLEKMRAELKTLTDPGEIKSLKTKIAINDSLVRERLGSRK